MNRCGLAGVAASMLAFLMTFFGSGDLCAQSEGEWDITRPRGEARTVEFTTDEGTWLSLDVSPDGETLVFDMVGEVWLLSIEGGEAEPITTESGIALDFHPQFSPDGSRIAFISDRGGQDNVWIMDADGSNPRQVSHQEDFRMFLPTWTPDGEFIVARVGGSSNGRGRGELWMWHVDGGKGVRLTGEGVNATWPTVSPDGRYLYYTERVDVGFGVPDPARGLHQVRRLDRITGDVRSVTSGTEGPWDGGGGRRSSGSAIAPEVSPDGSRLAFGRRVASGGYEIMGHEYGPRTALWIRDLETGRERVVMDPITPDAQGRNNSGALPRYDWTPDGRSIVITEGGKLWKLDVATGATEEIPFTAHVEQRISEPVMNPVRISDRTVSVQMMRWHRRDPHGARVAFSAVGRIWIEDARRASPRRLTPDSLSAMEFSPAWSADGAWIAFTTWDDVEGGHLWKIRPDGSGLTRLTRVAGAYLNPVWSPEGDAVVVVRGSGQMLRGRLPSDETWFRILAVPADGGAAREIAVAESDYGRGHVPAPEFGPEGRVFYLEHRGDRDAPFLLMSTRFDGLATRVHAELEAADEAALSPDGLRIAFQRGDNVYLAPLPWPGANGEPMHIGSDASPVETRRLSLDGGNFPHWIDAQTLEWGYADRHFLHDLRSGTTDTTSITLELPPRRPSGTVALRSGRIITMVGDEILPRGDIVVRGGRIVAVGRAGSVEIPDGAEVFDVSGKTVVPGFIDVHLHMAREGRGVLPEQSWEMAANLAYGITTALDPSAWGETIFTMAEMAAVGRQSGPRIFSTGSSLSRDVSPRHAALGSYEDAVHEVNRYADQGARAIKEYQQRRRDQRQWVVEAARRAGLNVTSEGDTDHLEALSLVMDGHTGFEHPILNIPLYRDVTEFMGQAKTFYSPTLVVGGIGPWGEGLFYQSEDLWESDKLRRFTPWRWLEPHTRRRLKVPESAYPIALHAQGVSDVIEAGGYGTIGAHGQQQGLASHMEMWLYASAADPMTVLRMSTVYPAKMIGVDRDVGTIETGKLADLVVLDADPLADIRNTTDIRFVMKAGVLYDGDTLKEVWPEAGALGEFYWRQPFARPDWSPDEER